MKPITPPAPNSFTTLGTTGGPILHPERGQPAHLLMSGEDPILIDCGEGALSQLAKIGVRYGDVNHLFITHHHFDHIGSLFGFIGLRMMTQRPGPLRIYGPIGTQRMVDGLLEASKPFAEMGFGTPNTPLPDLSAVCVVREVHAGDIVEVGDLRVSMCQNTHFSFDRGTPEDEKFKSLSFRFDLPGRSVVFTGDTGPCRDVEVLAQGVDLLVGEMMDFEMTVANIIRNSPNMPEPALGAIKSHLRDHHIDPTQLGEMAARANARQVVAVHIAPGSTDPADIARYVEAIGAVYNGEIFIGEDLKSY